MKSIKTHLWMFIFTLWALVGSGIVAPLLGILFGIEGMYYQLVLVPALFLPLCLIYPFIKRGLPVQPYDLKPLSSYDFIWTMIITILFWIIFSFLNLLPGLPMRPLQSFAGYPMWLPIVAAGIVGGTFETLFYHGLLYSDYRNQGITIWHVAIIVGIFATLIHVHPIQFMLILLTQRIIAVFMMYWMQSIWPAILMNVFVNVGIISFYFGIVTAENQAVLRLIFGTLSLAAIVTIFFGLKKMKIRYELLLPNKLTELSQKSFRQTFNWFFWILAVYWILLYIVFFL